ncbi:hypothetical protein P3T76_000758 [Phytophthora citrophthora]|uniref:Uncharacterized protein n=1 Tax=Phytophthora citrophthora TaxID=4793 RepID=A0AAD9H188_9STRA|nr:hypothetical protein P3T76_000758 [Phytophthora citrophthora]
MELVSSQDPNAATFAPVVCPLVSKKKNNLRLAECIESDAKRVLNEMYGKNGGRFFRVFTMKRGRRDQDFLDYHWDGIKGSSCKYCADPTRLKTQVVERIRLNCETVYRPLKAAMVKNLEFVRFVPQTGHCRLRKSENPYQGLIGGITEDGILCGAYLVEGLQTV